jgi:D-xylose transport system substrate-binding protein
MRRCLGIATAALLAVSGAACGGDDNGGGEGGGTKPAAGGKELKGKIAVLLPDTKSSDRWEKADRRFFREAFRAAGLKSSDYTIKNAQGDPSTQRAQAEQAITEGAKVILLTNLDSGSGAAIIAASKDQGVTMIDYDRLTLKGDADYYVSGNATDAGRLQGKGLVDDLTRAKAEKPAVAILDGAPTDSFATDLRKGYMEVLQPKFDSGEYRKAAQQAVPQWDGQQALTIFEQMLQKTNNSIDGVIAANDTLANSVITALKARNLDLVPTTGLDATAQALQHILAGEQSMTVYFSIKDQATKAANLAVQVARGQRPTGVGTKVDNGRKQVPTIFLKPVTIRKDNIADTVIADDFVSWEEVCVGRYTRFCPEDR